MGGTIGVYSKRVLAGSWQLPAIALVALALALLRNGSAAISGDESATWWATSLDTPDFWRLMENQDRVLLPYFAAIRLWSIFGQNISWLRAFSGLGAAVAVVCASGLARKMFGPAAAWYAAILYMITFPWIRFAQEARPYSWAVAFTAASMWAFYSMMRNPTRSAAVRYVAVSAFVPLAHLFAGMAVASQLLVTVLVKRWRLVIPVLLATIPTAVMALATYSQVNQVGGVDRLSPMGAVKSYLTNNFGYWHTNLAVQLLGVAGLVVIVLKARAEGGSGDYTRAILLAVWWLVPPPTLWLASEIFQGSSTPLFTPRYLLFTVPAAAIAASGLLMGIQSRRRGEIVVGLLVVGLVAVSIPGQVFVRSTTGHAWDAKDFASIIQDQRDADDAMHAPDWGVRLPVMYYLRNDLLPEPLILQTSREEGSYTPVYASPTDDGYRLAEYRRIWMLSKPELNHPIPSGFCVASSWTSEYDIARLALLVRC